MRDPELSALKAFLKRKNQRLHCTPAGSDNRDQTFTALITHETTTGLSSEEIGKLENELGSQEQLFSLLSSFGSIRLYCDTKSDDSAFYVANPAEWGELQNDFNVWLEDLDEDEREELLPEWLDQSVVFGEPPSSGNYFLYCINGNYKGQVFEFEHDGFEFIEIAPNIFEFVTYITSVTDKLIQNIHSHTRYSDGHSDIQWLAQSYKWDT